MNGAHLSRLILQNEKVVLERVSQRGADQLIETMVFQFVLKRFAPGGELAQFFQGNNGCVAACDPECPAIFPVLGPARREIGSRAQNN